MCAHHFVREFADRAGRDTPALVENAKLAGYAAREWRFLLHQ
jgi:hypothetical protein